MTHPQFIEVMRRIHVPQSGTGRPRIRPDHVLAARAYSSREIREYLRRREIPHTIPEKRDQAGHHVRRGYSGEGAAVGTAGSALEVVQAQAVFEIAVVMFDPPAHLGPPHRVSGRCGGGPVRYPVVRRGVLTIRPLDEEGLDGQDAVLPVAATARLLGCGQGLIARGPHGQHREP